MKALGRFPEFCGDSSTNCAIELATIAGHMANLSVDLKYTANIACSGSQLGTEACNYILNSDSYPAKAGEQYYGRGPFMLSFNTNYGQFSNAVLEMGLLDEESILKQPDLLTTDGEMSFMSAFWFYMYPQYPKPSMHDAILGYFTPSQADIDASICTNCI